MYVQGSKLHVRPCRSYDERKKNLQLRKFNSAWKLSLAGMAEGEFCVKATFRQLALVDSCGDTNDSSLVDFAFENGSITPRTERFGGLALIRRVDSSVCDCTEMKSRCSRTSVFDWWWFWSLKAIDGNLNIGWKKGSTATYKTDKNPWWQVTFSQDYEITLIKIYYMTNTGGSLLDSTLTIMRDDQSVYQHVTTAADLSSNPIVWTVPEAVGSTFKIQGAFNKGALRLTKVEVTGSNF